MTFAALPAHPLANLFPMMEQADIEKMGDDIVTFGLRHKIVLLDGMVLDGRNRQAACIFADVAPEYEDYDGDDPIGFVWSLNMERRHLTPSQKAMAGAKLCDWENGLNQFTGRANLPAREVGKKLLISERAIKAGRRIHEHGTHELVAAIEDGRIKIHVGEAISYLEREEQERVVRQEEKVICARAKEIRRQRQEQRHEGRLLHMSLVADAGKRTAGKISRRYGVYYADPPWKFGVHSEVTGREKSAENHYPTMTTEEIIALFTELAGEIPHDAVMLPVGNQSDVAGGSGRAQGGWLHLCPSLDLGQGNCRHRLLGPRPARTPVDRQTRRTGDAVARHPAGDCLSRAQRRAFGQAGLVRGTDRKTLSRRAQARNVLPQPATGMGRLGL
jgi:hypothetical protein